MRQLWLPTLLFVSLTTLSVGQDKDIKNIGIDKELQNKINQSIEKGVTWLKAKQEADGSFQLEARQERFPEGATIIALYTLLKCGISRDNEIIKKGFDWLKKSPLYNLDEKLYKQSDDREAAKKYIKTYSVSFLILALEAKYNSTEVVERATSAEVSAKMAKEDKEWLKRLHKWLVDHRYEYEGKPIVVEEKDKSTAEGQEKVKNIAWGYPGDNYLKPDDKWWDNSNTQFAVLALEACSRVGIATPEEVWIGIMNHFLSRQEKEGKKVKRIALDKERATTGETDVEDEARGWCYNPGKYQGKSTASMTCVGIASLTICRAELQKSKTYKKYSTTVEKSIRDGLGWLTNNFTIKKGWDLGSNYILYGLERVGVLAKTENIGKMLWYKEGATYLLTNQGEDGSWKGEWGIMPETCFALLFLSRSTFKVPGEGFQVETKR
ncbi:MAG: hypothetical protein A2W23_05415 [Planctomycetes bacterium RBG_16_43_13]|nr:MAG: hypothetical protein A2W23_05415 [Planctomycetes bacterium RBG_16_43_13]